MSLENALDEIHAGFQNDFHLEPLSSNAWSFVRRILPNLRPIFMH